MESALVSTVAAGEGIASFFALFLLIILGIAAVALASRAAMGGQDGDRAGKKCRAQASKRISSLPT